MFDYEAINPVLQGESCVLIDRRKSCLQLESDLNQLKFSWLIMILGSGHPFLVTLWASQSNSQTSSSEMCDS